MSEHQPYNHNEPRFSNLPDENGAWENMKARLDGEEKKRRFLLLPFLTGCGGWSLLLLLLLGGGLWWWMVDGSAKKETAVTVQQTDQDANSSTHRSTDTQPTGGNQKEKTTNPQQKKTFPERTIAPKKNDVTKKRTGKKVASGIGAGNKATPEKSKKDPTATAINTTKTSKGKSNLLSPVEGTRGNVQQVEDTVINSDTAVHINTVAAPPSDTNNKDTSSIDTTATLPPLADTARKLEVLPKKENQFFIAAGITLQQQLPLGDQQWVPYNYRGRKGSWADYVPAIDLRLYKGQQWFIQSGFRYGAPQYTRSFIYTRNLKTDTTGTVTGTTSYRLRKTYYHQLPLSFHHRIKESWWAGVGVVFNKFYGAVSEKEERQQVTQSTDSLISKMWVRDRNDSVFRNSNVQLMLQMQYQWKRFAAGAQFSQGVQPFIEYRNEQGQTKKQKNHSFNIFIRYELWRQKS